MSNSVLFFLVVLLGVTVLIVPITTRLGLGSVIGYLIGGAIIGPSGMGWIANAEEILHLAEFGVVMLLFLIGLELNPRRLWNLRSSIFGMGLLQVSLSAALLGLAVYAYGWQWQTALVAGLATAMSSTAIAMQIIGEKSLRTHPAGQTGFSILLFQDLAVIPILLLVGWLSPKVSDSGSIFTGVARYLAPIAAILLIVLGGTYLSRPVFRWIASTRARDLSISFSLLIIVGIAYMMHMVGMSMALGSFLAGVILAESEYRHELEANIEPFKGLLLGLFFLAVGMGIEIFYVLEHITEVLSFTAGILGFKIGVIFAIGIMFKIHWRSSLLLAFLLAQGGEFAFVLLGQALQGELMTNNEVALLNASVTLSMLLTPLLILLYDKLGFQGAAPEKPPHDAIEDEGHEVIVCGFGRVGQVVTRLLHLNGITTTIIDHDPEQVDSLRKFGWKAYYGDATNMALLEAAGIARAKLVIIAVDNRDTIGLIAAEVKRTFPRIKIVSRAFDRPHLYELMELNLDHIERETFSSSLSMGEKVLELMGVKRFEAHRMALRFMHYDLETLKQLAPFYRDETQFISRSREARETLEKLFAQDQANRGIQPSGGWD